MQRVVGAPVALGRSHVRAVKTLLRDLPIDYPGGDAWLDSRLADVLDGRAECWVAAAGDQVAGTVILTPKSSALKLSTIFVAPLARGRGIGGRLMDETIAAACRHGCSEVYVTVAEHKVSLLEPLLTSRGFIRTAVEADRYGPGRTEVIYSRLES